MTKLKEALEKLLEAAHPAYVSDDHFRKKLIVARDNALQELESHRLDMKDHIADAGKMVSLRDQFAMQAMQAIASNSSAMANLGKAGERELVDPDLLLSSAAYAIADAMLKVKEREK